jgi:tetratricopeptide (TPR) repeat protein
MNDTSRSGLRDLTAAVRRSPHKGEAWFRLAHFLHYQTDHQRFSARAYERAQALAPDRDLRAHLGSALVYANQVERGIALIEDAIADDPQPSHYRRLAVCLLRDGQVALAEQVCRSALALDPASAHGRFLLGEALRDASPEEAVASYRDAIRTSPDFAAAWQSLGRSLIETDQIDSGIAALRRAAECDPYDPYTQAYLGNGLWRSKAMDAAARHYRHAVRLARRDSDLRRICLQFFETTGIDVSE